MKYNHIRNDETEIDLGRLIFTIMNRWRTIILFGIVGAVLFGAIVFYTSMSYESEAAPYFKSTTTMEIIFPDENNEQLLAVLELTRSTTVLKRAIKNINTDLEIDDLVERVSVSAESKKNSAILEISVMNENANLAQELADEIRETAKKFINNSMYIISFKVIEQANLPNEPILEEIDEKNDNIIGNILRRMVFGGFLGVFVSVFIIFIDFLLNDKIQTPDDVERYLGKRVLASIPLFEGQVDNNIDMKYDRGVERNGQD